MTDFDSEKTYPLTSSQREIWFDQALYPDLPLYNIGGYSQIDGPLDPGRLEQALNRAVARHDGLRIVLAAPSGDGLPRQELLNQLEVRLPFDDLSGEKNPHTKALAWMQEQVQVPFSLHGKSLFQFALIRISPSRHYLFKKYHHLITDGWGASLIDHSLAEAYNALEIHNRALHRDSYSYKAFIEDDRAYLDSERFEKDEAYWTGKYKDIPEPLFSPRPEGMKGSSPSRRRTFHLKRPFYDRLTEYARAKKVSLFHVILGALYVYFTRISQRDEFIIGLPVLNRRGAAFKKTVGLFTGVIPARFSFGVDREMDELLRKIASTLRQDYRRQRYPISELNRRIGLHRMDRRQVFDVNLSYEKHDYAVRFGDAKSMTIAVPNQYSQDPLSIYIREFHAAEDVAVDFDYNLGYFTDRDMEALEERFVCILEKMIENSNHVVKTFPIITDREKHLVLSEFNRTKAAYPEDKTVVDLFEEQAKGNPNHVALVFEDREMTYGELNARANQLARYLTDLKDETNNDSLVTNNELVGICLERSPEMVVGILGILKAGGAYVPLDPDYPRERLAFMLEDSGIKVLLTREKLLSGLSERSGDPASPFAGRPPTSVLLDRDGSKISEYPKDNLGSRARPTDLSYVIYTSGSTGRPKGVMIEHRALTNHMLWMGEAFEWTGKDRFLQKTPFSFDASVWEFFAPLTGGSVLAMARPGSHRDGEALIEEIQQNQISVLQLVPSQLKMLCESEGLSGCSSLRGVWCGGERLDRDACNAFFDKGLNAALYNLYGPTEGTIDITFDKRSPGDDGRSIGRPITNTRAYVLDRYLQPLPVGIPGELCIAGAGLARGYLNRPDLTAEKFLEVPIDGVPTRFYRTGDLARWLPDGDLEFLGRVDHQIKLRGFRIEPGEIESKLLQRPQVREAAVILLDEDGNPRLAGFITLKEGGDQSPDRSTLPSALRKHLKKSLPEYMAPSSITLLDAMPLTPNGKLDRKALAGLETYTPTEAFVPPRTDAERRFASIWSDVMKREGIGVRDNFFELGGDSILSMRIVSRARARGLEITPRDIFDHQTIEELALAARGTQSAFGEQGPGPSAGHASSPDSGLKVAREVPASPGQEGMWLERRDRPPSSTYSVPFSLDLAPGLAEPERVREALERIASRHEPMRTVLVERDGILFQRVLSPGPVDLTVHDLTRAPDPKSAMAALTRAEYRRPFDLQAGPLFRYHLCLTAGGSGILIGNADHAVFDGWSMGVLKRELTVILEAIARSTPVQLPPLAVSYSEAIASWRADLSGARGRLLHAFWRERLLNLEIEELPPDGSSAGACITGSRILVELGPEISSALECLIQNHNQTLSGVWIAAVAALLSRYKDGVGQVSVGVPFAGRLDPRTDELIGHFVNLLPVILPGDWPLSFGDLLTATRTEVMAVFEHQDTPLSWLTSRAAGLGRRPDAPLFDAVATLEDSLDPDMQLRDEMAGAGKFPLMLTLVNRPGDKHALAVEYDTGRFSAARMERMAGHLQRLLLSAAENPEKPLGTLDILPAEERTRVVVHFNRTARPYRRDASLTGLFREAARAHADRPALTWAEGEMTYSELDRESDRIAAGLAANGASPGEVIGLSMDRGPLAILAILGMVKAGCAYLPLERGFPPELAVRLLADCKARLVVTDGPGRARMVKAGLSDGLLALDDLNPDAPPPAVPPGGEAPAYVMFTSGTTGEPKGVMVPQRAVARLVVNPDFLTLTPEDGMAQAAPLGFDASTLEIWAPLMKGARVCVLEEEVLLDPAALADGLRDRKINVMWLTASLMNRLAEEDPTCLRPLRALLSGGEALSPVHVRRVLEACPGLSLINGYGPTENTTFTTTHPVDLEVDLAMDPAVDLEQARAASIPIGRPIANTTAYVLDRLGNPAPLGVWGELYAGGDGLALGYAGRPDLTEASFVTRPWLTGQRLYRTGDLARWREDGVLLFGGRRDGQVKVRGHRVETGAVETALRALPGIGDAAVLALGEGGDRTLAAVVAATRDDQEQWRAELARSLPDFMVPERFLTLPSLPVTASGKADRRVLADRMVRTPSAPSNRREPSSPGERLMAELWGELFPGVTLDASSNFFALGGHSLVAMRLAGLIERRTGRRPAVRDLLTAGTLESMAAVMDTAPRGRDGDEIPPAPGPDYPLSSGQARLWMLARLYPDSAAYNVPLALDLAGELEPDALQQALTALEERQHALRMRMRPAPDDPVGVRQVLAPAGGLRMERLDCSDAPDPEARAAALTEEQILRPFRLEEEAPARAFLLDLGRGRWRFLMVLHHASCDAWSLPLIWRDLAGLYARALGGPGPSLPPLSRSYEDFAAWQQSYQASPEGQTLLERWKLRLTPLPAPLDLPRDRPRPPIRRFRGDCLETSLSPGAGHALEALAATRGSTTFTVLLSLLQVLLWRHTGQTDLTLGTLAAGRQQADLTDLVGFFVNTLVLRQTLDPAAGLSRHLSATREILLEAIADQDCPFESLVEAVGAPRDTARNPLFDVLAVWHDGQPPLPEMQGLTVSSVDTPFPFAKFDLGFYFFRQDGDLRIHAEFDTDLFDRSGVEAILRRFRYLVDQALSDPDQPLSRMEVMDPEERHLVVDGFNATERELDIERTIPSLFLKQLADAPERAAVQWKDKTLSYREFARRAGGVAESLTRAGVSPGQVVALCARRSPEMLLAIHGILMAGGAYAPLDPADPEARRVEMLEDLGNPLVLAPPELAGLFAGRRVLTLNGTETGTPAQPPVRPDDLAYVIFTSGSTGRPKGVMIEHRSILNRILWMQETFPLGPGDVILQKTPITFDVSVWELFWWSWVDAAIALPPPGAERDPQALVEAVARHRVTVMHFVPSMLAEFLSYLESGREKVSRLASLRYVFASGEALDAGLVERFNRLLHAPLGVELHNLYGPTEAAVDVSWQPCSPWEGGSTVPIGRPIANTRLYVLDPDLKPLPVGVSGEVCIGGVQVGRGYINRPDLTSERFMADPLVPGGRIYRTGDRGRWRRDGVIEYLGRYDHQVKVRGHRIEIAEIERALESHPGVERALVTPERARGLVELHAHIMGRGGLDSAGLRRHLRESLPEYMLPARFLRIRELPLASSGKVDRKALKGIPLDPAFHTRPLAPFEAEVLAVWRQILPDADPGVQSSFFDAGGNSLLVIRLHERLEARWPGVFSVAELFARATAADQAALLAGVMPESSAPEPSRPRGGSVAIVGLAVRLAGGGDLDGFWRDLAGGVDRVHALSPDRTAEARALSAALGRPAPTDFRQAAYLDDIYAFDSRRLRMTPMDAALLDPEQRLFLETAVMALEDAGYGGRALDKDKVGVFVGATPLPYYREAMGRLHPERAEQVFTLNVPSNAATRLSFLHDWRGPAALVDTACSSGLAAVHTACRALADGECRVALAGSAKVMPLPPDEGTGRLTINSSTDRTRAFSADADGTGMGEGAVVMVLKSLEAALADGDAVHAVILGSAMNQDGASSGMAAPNPAAQAEVIAAAAKAACVGLETLSYLEAHGTGTALGDPIEIDGLIRAFSAATSETGFAALGAVKGNYGHLDAAAGALGLAKAALCLKRDAAPPLPFFSTPNPRIDFKRAPVHIPAALEPLADRGGPRRAGVSSFGLSGINVHVILEAAPARASSLNPEGTWLTVGLSAAGEKALRQYAADLAKALRADPTITPAQCAHTLAMGRDLLEWRTALVAATREEFLEGLDRVAAGESKGVQAPPAGPERFPAGAPACSEDRADAEAAARTFLAGGELTWPGGSTPNRVHLPAAPLVRRTCRPDFGQLADARPVLGPMAATPQGRAWRVPLEEPDFWPAAEHRLEGRPTLVGMALPGLLAESARDLGLGPALCLREMAWLKPLRPRAVTPGSASLILTKHPGGGEFEASLGALSLKGDWTVFARAGLSEDHEPLSRGDLPGLRRLCGREAVLPPFSANSGAIEVSRRWDCRIRAWQSADGQEALVLLRLPDEFSADRGRYPFHPALLDVASGLALDRPGLLLAGCGRMRLPAPLPPEMLAHVVRRQSSAGELTADATLYDPSSGAALVAMTGLHFIRPGGAILSPGRSPGRSPGLSPALSLPAWRSASLPEGAACPGPVAVVGEGDLARRLAAYLSEAGRLSGHCGSADPDPTLIRMLQEGRAASLALVPSGGDDLAWRSARVLRKVLTGLRQPVKVLLAGHGAYVLDETDPSPDPEAGLLAGLALAAAREEPLMSVRYLDLDPATPPALAAAEFAAFDAPPDGPTPVALLRGGRRFVQTWVPLSAAAAPAAWPEEGCCVVTGGLGGFALTLAEELAGGGLSLALLSRRDRAEVDDPEADFRRRRLEALADAGVRFRTYACDVSDRKTLSAALERIRTELGPISAVVHAAGVADGAFLLRQDRSSFQAVLAAKARGAQLLDELTRSDPLRAFVLFGSLTGLTGAPGQSAYAAANAYLAALAAWRHGLGRPGLCIDWCALEGVGMAARSRRIQGQGPSLDADGARAAWRVALQSGRDRVALLPPLGPDQAEGPKAEALTASRPATPSPPTSPAASTAPTGDLETALAAIWAQVLGYDHIGAEDNFFSLGGDSITGMQTVTRVVEELGLPASLDMLFEHDTPAALARALIENRAGVRAGAPAAGLQPAPPAPDYPVAWEQMAVLRAEAAGEMETAFNLPCLVELPTDMDPARLRSSLEELTARHESLRTLFLRDGDDFRMRVAPPSPIELPVLDIPPGEVPWEAGRARVRPFDLFDAPPVRFELLRSSDGKRMLFMDLHHALADGLSQELLVGDLAALYAGAAGPAPTLQLKDYAWWSREGAGATRLEEDRTWWRERFSGPLPLTDLPADHPRPPRHTWRGDTVSFVLDPDLLEELRTYAAAHQVTTFAVVLGAWAALVHRLARTEDVVIAVPVDARDRVGRPDLPGMMVSLLPLRLRVTGDQTAAELIRRSRTAHTESLGHRAGNLALLLADLAPPAAPDRTLLSEVTLSYMNFIEAAPAAGEPGGFNLVGLTRDSCKNDLGIFIRDLPGRMMVSLEYYADLFDRPRIERLGRQFETLLAGLVRAPSDRTVDRLPIMDRAEEERLLSRGRGARPDLPLDAGIFSLFAAQAVQRGEAVAVEEAGRRVTYAELHDQALALAGGLRSAGVKPGDRVALHVERGCAAVAALLGILAAGASYVPLDPAYPPERNRFILSDADCRAVLADASGRRALGEDPPSPVLDPVLDLVLEVETLPARERREPLDLPQPGASLPAYLMYTSGSTGRPKGVLISQGAVIRLALGADYAGLGPEDGLLQTGPLAFDASTFEIWGALLNGARVCVADWESLLDPANLAGLITRFNATVIWLTSGLFNRQVEHDPASFRGAKVVITGGEALSPVHARRALAACPGVRFLNGYGPTENTTFSLIHPLTPEGLAECPGAIGRPILHSEALVLDPAGGLVPEGIWGEICVGGPGLAEGYWQQPELTARRFTAHPWRDGERLYWTGDQGRWRGGVIEFGGRQDSQIKLRGLRIELEEIDRALAEHPAIGRGVALLHRPIAGEPEIIAAITPAAEGTAFDTPALRRWLGRRLPSYMVPARLTALEDIPVTANGKVDRDALLSRLDQARLDQARLDQDGPAPEGGHAPRGPLERMVAEVFSQVFGRPVRDRRAHFLEMGGHSLLAIKVVNRLAERTGVRLPIRDFYAAADLAELARLLEPSRPPGSGDIPLAPPLEVYPASHSQQRLYLLHQMEGGSGAYNMCFAFRCDGSLEPSALARALRRLCRRHEPLRTGFEEQEGRIVQRIASEAAPEVLVDDLNRRDDPWQHALRLARREVSTPFDLARPPLARARVLRVGEDEALLLLVLHHIVGDGWSSRILVRELGLLYASARSGQTAGLSPLPLTYKDFALWQQTQRWEGASDFWRDRLAGAPPRIALPTDRPLPETQSYRGATCRRDLSPEVLDGLKALAGERSATLGAVGLALFAALLYRLTRQGDMVLGMGVAGRERTGLEGLIGFFVNVLPIRLSVSDDTELDSLIDQAREAVLQALDWRDYPFDVLVRDLAPPRQGNRQPLINVVFEYQNFGPLGQDGPGLPIRPGERAEVQDSLAALVESHTAKHDLLVFLVEEMGGARLQMEYDTDIFDPATAEGWLGYLEQFMARAARTAPRVK